MFRKEIDDLLKLPPEELMAKADKARAQHSGAKMELCSIINAKSGLCAEDCKYCAQASRHKTGIETYPLKGEQAIVEAAERAKAIGAQKFGIVTSGDLLSKSELSVIAKAITAITRDVGIKACASLGGIGEHGLTMLKKAGLTRYHHNIETSPGYFDRIVTTHRFEDRLRTIRAAKAAGLEVCSGGIIGMGESQEDRIQMALILKELNVDSVPLNVLMPIAGTPLENQRKISSSELLKTIALFRLILKDKPIKLAAGREAVLGDSQKTAFMAGANSMMIGGYLTTKGNAIEEDHALIKEVEQAWRT